MDMQTNSPSPRKAPVADDLFDDFDFKPLSKGLGFHHANKSEEAVKEAILEGLKKRNIDES